MPVILRVKRDGDENLSVKFDTPHIVKQNVSHEKRIRARFEAELSAHSGLGSGRRGGRHHDETPSLSSVDSVAEEEDRQEADT